MCSYIVEKARLVGTAKGPNSAGCGSTPPTSITTIPTRRSSTTRSCVDFICEADGGRERVAIEISRELALELIERIKAALASGDASHAKRRGVLAGRARRPTWRRCSRRPPLRR